MEIETLSGASPLDWLLSVSDSEPVIYPYWPRSGYLPVYVECPDLSLEDLLAFSRVGEGESPLDFTEIDRVVMGVAERPQDLPTMRKLQRLWFCEVPITALQHSTTFGNTHEREPDIRRNTG